jgi:hypothetical protein
MAQSSVVIGRNPQKSDKRISVRLTPDQVAALDALAAAEHGGNRSKAMQALIDDATAAGTTGTGAQTRMDLDDLRDCLEARARAGSVTAIKELRIWIEREAWEADNAARVADNWDDDDEDEDDY